MHHPHVVTFVLQEQRQGERSVVVIVRDQDAQRAARLRARGIIAGGGTCGGRNLAHAEFFAKSTRLYVASGRRKKSGSGDTPARCRTITTTLWTMRSQRAPAKAKASAAAASNSPAIHERSRPRALK